MSYGRNVVYSLDTFLFPTIHSPVAYGPVDSHVIGGWLEVTIMMYTTCIECQSAIACVPGRSLSKTSCDTFQKRRGRLYTIWWASSGEDT